MRATRGKTLETVPFQPYFGQSTVKLVLPSNESYGSKTGCNRTLATVLWVPLKFPDLSFGKQGKSTPVSTVVGALVRTARLVSHLISLSPALCVAHTCFVW